MKKTELIPPLRAHLVLDTNIIMDMLHFADPATAPLLAALTDGRLLALTDPDCLAELERVLAYPEFRLEPAARTLLLERYRRLSECLPGEDGAAYVLPRCRDADDQKFLILAARSRADLLVTRDKLLLRLAQHKRTPPPCPIVKADEACRRLGLASVSLG